MSVDDCLKNINEIIGDNIFSNIMPHLDILIKSKTKKRKRNKHQIPLNERCIAKKNGGEQCTRRKKNDLPFLLTHPAQVSRDAMPSTSSSNRDNAIGESDPKFDRSKGPTTHKFSITRNSQRLVVNHNHKNLHEQQLSEDFSSPKRVMNYKGQLL